MRVVALMPVRNEADMLPRSLAHLASQGVEAAILDHGSTDASRAIAESHLKHDVCRLESIPFEGFFDLPKILATLQRWAADLSADWFLLQSVDHIRTAPPGMGTLAEAFETVSRARFTAAWFDEFVFVPPLDDLVFHPRDYPDTQRHYYHHKPRDRHRIDAWRKTGAPIDFVSEWGLRVRFDRRKVYETPFILRHHMALSVNHAQAKFGSRVFDQATIQNAKFHRSRVWFNFDALRFPGVPPEAFHFRNEAADRWDRSHPLEWHDWLGPKRFVPLHRCFDCPVAPPPQPLPLQAAAGWHWGGGPCDRDVPPLPVIVGVPRSGTTLLRLMLDAHPELAIPPETQFLLDLRRLESEPDPADRRLAFSALIRASERWPHFGLTADALDAALDLVPSPFTLTAGLRAFYALYAKRFNKRRSGEKTPAYSQILCEILHWLPEARFIHVIRDGRDMGLSLKDLWWGPGQDMARQAAFWQGRIRDCRQQAQFVPHYLEIRYEDLLTETESVLRRLCAFLDLPFDPAMLRYHEHASDRIAELVETGASGSTGYQVIHQRTSAPPDPSRIGKWRADMSATDRYQFHQVAGALLRDLGYES